MHALLPEGHDFKDVLGYQEEITLNKINFQITEKEEGWLRHCGPYAVEIFTAIHRCIVNKKNIMSDPLLNTSIEPHGISLQTALSVIPSGQAENIPAIRNSHILLLEEILTQFKNSQGIEETQEKSACWFNFSGIANTIRQHPKSAIALASLGLFAVAAIVLKKSDICLQSLYHSDTPKSKL